MNWFKSFWQRLTAPPPSTPRVRIRQGTHSTPASQEHSDMDTRFDQDATSTEKAGNFTPRAQQVLSLARKEAERYNHNFVGTEHLLLGLIKLGKGVAVTVLQKMGLDFETVRIEVEQQVGTGPDQKMVGNIPYTPRVKRVLALAAKEAKTLRHTFVGTEHILLGLLREGDGVAARVLKILDVDIEQTRQEILKELDPNYASSADASKPTPITTATSPRKQGTQVRISSAQPPGEPVDLSKSYDVYCTDWSQGVTVYRNVRFQSVKQLFQRSPYDMLSNFVELEQSDGQIVFVSRSSITKFCEHSANPGGENAADTSV